MDAIAGTGAVILDTRKTTPGLRFLEKYAVKCGGGENHRLALWDMYLIKDNHIRAAGGVTAAIERILRTRHGDLLLEVEVESLDQLREALRPEVDRILVDNRSPDEVRRAVEVVDAWCAAHPSDSPRQRPGARRWPEVEVSGGITLATARAYAECGRGLPLDRGADALGARPQPEPGDRGSWIARFDRTRFAARLATRRLGRSLLARADRRLDQRRGLGGARRRRARRHRGRGRRADARAAAALGRRWHTAPGKSLALSVLLREGCETRGGGAAAAGGGPGGGRGARVARRAAVAQVAERRAARGPQGRGRAVRGPARARRWSAPASTWARPRTSSRRRSPPPRRRWRWRGWSRTREDVAAAFLGALEARWDALRRDGPAALLEAWSGRAAFWGREVTVRAGGGELRGVARGLDAGGALRLALADGTETVVRAGDLEPGAAEARA